MCLTGPGPAIGQRLSLSQTAPWIWDLLETFCWPGEQDSEPKMPALNLLHIRHVHMTSHALPCASAWSIWTDSPAAS